MVYKTSKTNVLKGYAYTIKVDEEKSTNLLTYCRFIAYIPTLLGNVKNKIYEYNSNICFVVGKKNFGNVIPMNSFVIEYNNRVTHEGRAAVDSFVNALRGCDE